MQNNDHPLSLYIHFPWCVQKCPYCDFNSHALRESTLPEAAYIDRLCDEIDHKFKHLLPSQPFKSLFLGGGTPSLFSAASLRRLLAHIQEVTETDLNCEITLEANPGTMTNDKFHAFREAGLNRLSIGIQSLNNEHLRALGRIHDSDQALDAISKARDAGFERINADIMFGLPKQTQSDAMRDLDLVCAEPITHLSWYQLTLEPNTLFHRFPPPVPTDDDLAEIQDAGQTKIAQAGFGQYEISAYCRQNDRCVHNLNYWEYGDYIGIGAGAHSKLQTKSGDTIRLHNTKHPKAYMTTPMEKLYNMQVIPLSERPLEFFMNAARLEDPILKSRFSQKTGLSTAHIKPAIEMAKEKGLLTETQSSWLVTPLGHRFLNELLAVLMAHPPLIP